MRTRIVIRNVRVILILFSLLSIPVSNTAFGQVVSPIPAGAEPVRLTDSDVQELPQ